MLQALPAAKAILLLRAARAALDELSTQVALALALVLTLTLTLALALALALALVLSPRGALYAGAPLQQLGPPPSREPRARGAA